MQLIEFFLWRNIENRQSTYLFSAIGQLLISLQPIISLLLLSNTILKLIMISLYLIYLAVVFFTHKKVFKTSVEKGHLKWSWIPIEGYVYYIWMFFLTFSFIVNKHYAIVAVALALFVMTLKSPGGTGGSLWCWSINISMLLYATYLLLYLPFQEIKSC
jgi:hypothetical protein